MDSVFPEKLTGANYQSDGRPDDWIFCGGGLTKRELFAMQFTAALVRAESKGAIAWLDEWPGTATAIEHFSSLGLRFADALIAELAKERT